LIGEGNVGGAVLYRVERHPLIANNTHYEVDPSSIQLSKQM
jgi:hypothetical protein